MKKKKPKDIFENIFGKTPKKGYHFSSVNVTLIDNDYFKGFVISWSAIGIGFGEVTLTWGLDKERLKEFPNQQGFHTDTECMSNDFVEALMKKAAPKFAELIIKHDITFGRSEHVSK